MLWGERGGKERRAEKTHGRDPLASKLSHLVELGRGRRCGTGQEVRRADRSSARFRARTTCGSCASCKRASAGKNNKMVVSRPDQTPREREKKEKKGGGGNSLESRDLGLEELPLANVLLADRTGARLVRSHTPDGPGCVKVGETFGRELVELASSCKTSCR